MGNQKLQRGKELMLLLLLEKKLSTIKNLTSLEEILIMRLMSLSNFFSILLLCIFLEEQGEKRGGSHLNGHVTLFVWSVC